MRTKLCSISKIYALNLENIILYYKLLGINLLDLENLYQQQNHVPLTQKVDKILLLKELFECDRMNRMKRSKINLKSGLNATINQMILHKCNT